MTADPRSEDILTGRDMGIYGQSLSMNIGPVPVMYISSSISTRLS